MEISEFLTRLGFRPGRSGVDKAETFYYITNPDGTPRWIWPASVQEPLFLKFYHTGTSKARLFAEAVKLMFRLKLQHLIVRKATVSLEVDNQSLVDRRGHWALFTGTPGPNRKAIVFVKDGDQESFLKIAVGENSKVLLNNETAVLEILNTYNDLSFQFPVVKGRGSDVVEISALRGKRFSSGKFLPLHDQALRDMKRISGMVTRVDELPAWKLAMERLDSLEQSADPRIPKGLVRKLRALAGNIRRDMPVETSRAHGDFTPWNMFIARKRLQVFDWELSLENLPFAFDAFHYIIQNGILVERKPWTAINKDLQVLSTHERILSHYNEERRTLHLSLYLIIHITNYLQIYQKQSSWHTQVAWQLNTWNEAVSCLLSDSSSHRKLVMVDLFDFLNQGRYAALKFSQALPEDVDTMSDIDIATDKTTWKLVSERLQNHCLVREHRVLLKSFMATEQFILADGSMLSVDFIWKFKRRAIEFLNIDRLLNNSRELPSGVRIPSAADEARYVGLFYGLNGAMVPERYRRFESGLIKHFSRLDLLLAEYYKGNKSVAKEFARVLKSYSFNRGLSGLINQVNYFLDVFRGLSFSKGMVVTFSGVDGAGKSTVIDAVKTRVEKQLRRRVVVLRHRPSLLPILSAWTKGKSKAEADAASRLPRQGNNSSTLSSLLRFGYYFADYLIGQFYVYFRYVVPGYVVLYDRYYFDFVNDAKRSNIHLPSFLVKSGYTFLLKPRLNFFLYAPAEVILSRKQELDANTIEELTQRYLSHFSKLGKSRRSKYVPVNNVELHKTLDVIWQRVTSIA